MLKTERLVMAKDNSGGDLEMTERESGIKLKMNSRVVIEWVGEKEEEWEELGKKWKKI